MLAVPRVGAAAAHALSFDGVNDHVTFGQAAALGSSNFSVECWFKRLGAGVSVSTGSGGVTAIPLVTKGRGEADGNNKDMNYFLGIRATDGVLVADFEEGAGGSSPGLNHPVIGKTPVANNVWYHAAASYDGTNFLLFLNGVLETKLFVNKPPRHDSIQHAAVGTAMNSAGVPSGYFHGLIDEVRIWCCAQSPGEICTSCNLEVPSARGLVGHYALNEGSGTTANNDAGTGPNGTLVNGPAWVTDGPTLYLAGFQPAGGPPPADYGLDLRGTDYVNFGDAGVLRLTSFTLELWFRREGAGVTTTLSSAAVIPLIAKGCGCGEGDGTVGLNFNYFFGIRATDNVLFADFEEANGVNHQVTGTTPIANNTWYHAAVTYDSTTRIWRLYLNGASDRDPLVLGAFTPNSASTHAVSVGTSLKSDGARHGFFDGMVDAVRIWSTARTQEDIIASMNGPVAAQQNLADLAAAWSLDEGADSIAYDFNNRVSGTVFNNATAVSDRWVLVDRVPPAISSLVPANNALGVSHFPLLKATVTDDTSPTVSAWFYGRKRYASTTPDFTIVLIPDTQHYVDNENNVAIYGIQTQWIVDNRYNPGAQPYLDSGAGIVFVSHLGDIVEHRDESPSGGPNDLEWSYADWYQGTLDWAGVPNNVTVGNHDITNTGVGVLFDTYFPPSRYTGFSWYGGWMGKNPGETDRLNKNNYELFSVGDLKFIVLHLEMDVPDAALNWAAGILEQYADRRAMITTHAFINASGVRNTALQWRLEDASNPNTAQEIWDRLIRNHRNVFLVVNGHHQGEASLISKNDWGEDVIQLCQDYQNDPRGGNGWLRTLVFRPAENKIDAYTYSPFLGQQDRSGNSRLRLDYDMQGPPFEIIGYQPDVSVGTISQEWIVFDKAQQYTPMRNYEWFVEVSDGQNSARSSKQVFQTRNDTFAYLYPTGSDSAASALAVNNTRKVVGFSGTGPTTAVSWQVDYSSTPIPGIFPTLLTVPAAFSNTRGTGIGVSKMVGNGDDFEFEDRPFYSEGPSAGILPALQFVTSYAFAANNHPTAPIAVGNALTTPGFHACFWNLTGPPTVTDLVPTGPLASESSCAYDVNDLATPQIVGEVSSAASGTRAVVWRGLSGSATVLGFLGGDNRATARGINDKETIVGWSWHTSQNVPRAVRWDYNGTTYTATALPLPDTLPANSPSYALEINNRDMIVGYVYDASGLATGYSWPPGNLAVVWVSGTPYFLFHFIPPDYSVFFQTAYDINDDMDIIGEAGYGPGFMGYMLSR